MFSFRHGNILSSDTEAIVNTVNTVGVMGKGIALQFKKAFPENFKAYSRACKKGEIQIGRMFVFEQSGLTNPKLIINFPTKKHWREKSKLSYIKEGLEDLVAVIRSSHIRSIAIPPLGCGNGGLSWSEVRPLIEKALFEVPDVEALIYEPAPFNSDQIKTKGTRPNLTPNRASLLKLIDAYLQTGSLTLGKLEVQKLLYFLQFTGQPLRLRFVKNQFGPYDQAVEHVLEALDQYYIVGYGDRSSLSRIRLAEGVIEEAEAVLASDDETRERLERVIELIEGFETSFGMELLATVHWVLTHDKASTIDEVFERIQTWSKRKRQIFAKEHVAYAVRHLHEQGWDEQKYVQVQ